MREIFKLFCCAVGFVTTIHYASIMLVVFVDEIAVILRNQKKNKRFCHHEYELKWVDGIEKECDRYIFVCRKCKKRLEINACNKVTESRTFYGSKEMLLVYKKEKEYE